MTPIFQRYKLMVILPLTIYCSLGNKKDQKEKVLINFPHLVAVELFKYIV